MKGDTNGLKERDRGTQRQRDIGIQTDRATERHKDRETERQRDRTTEQQRDIKKNKDSKQLLFIFCGCEGGVTGLTLKVTKRNNKKVSLTNPTTCLDKQHFVVKPNRIKQNIFLFDVSLSLPNSVGKVNYDL